MGIKNKNKKQKQKKSNTQSRYGAGKTVLPCVPDHVITYKLKNNNNNYIQQEW